jgi:hypothetical protein
MRSVLTSRAVALRAIRAHRHLYRMSDCDDPDLGLNVTFAVEQDGLVRLAEAEPWPLADSVRGRVLPLLALAERVADPWTATAYLSGFAHAIHAALERRAGQGRAPGSRLRRRGEPSGERPACRTSNRRELMVAGPRSLVVAS